MTPTLTVVCDAALCHPPFNNFYIVQLDIFAFITKNSRRMTLNVYSHFSLAEAEDKAPNGGENDRRSLHSTRMYALVLTV